MVTTHVMGPSMLLPRFDFEAPSSLADACAAVAGAGDEARMMAGGTDLLVKMKRGTVAPRLVVSLGRIDALRRIRFGDRGLHLGACATMTRIAADPVVRASYRALAEGAGSVGGPLVRNRATVGGNVINARPCADTLPPLIALGATLRLAGLDTERCVPVEGFVHAPGACDLRAGEVAASIEMPAPPANSGSAYVKITRRAAMDATLVGCAAAVVLDGEKRSVVRARLVFSSSAPVPLRVRSAEEVLEGRAPTASVVDEAAAEARLAAPVIGDHRAPQDYRAEMVELTARRAIRFAVERAGGRVG